MHIGGSSSRKEDERLIVIRATRGDGFRISADRAGQRPARTKASLLVPDTALDAALREADSIVVQHVRTLMAVPLQTDEQVIGLLVPGHARGVPPVDSEMTST